MDHAPPRNRLRSQSLDVPRRLSPVEEHNALPPYHATEIQHKNPSLDFTQRIERKLAQHNASQNVFMRWLFEIISWMVSAFSMGAVIGILIFLKDNALDTWPPGLTISTFLSKLASAALIPPISEAIGQLKWNWFHGKSKEMWDFEIFDKASRGGAWGSIMLLFRTKGRSLAALGAILTILLLATDAFFQQLVETPERWILSGKSALPKAVRYEPATGSFFRAFHELSQQDEAFASIMDRFFYDNGTQPLDFANGTQPDISVSCPTNNCTWPDYESLGVCSSCTELPPEYLTFACLSTRVDWVTNLTSFMDANYPNGTMCGYFLNATSDAPVFVSGYLMESVNSTAGGALQGETLLMRTIPLVTNPMRERLFDGSINFKHIRNPILDFLIFTADGIDNVHLNETPVAFECVLHWCVKSIRSRYYAARYDEEIIQTNFNNTPGPYPWEAYRVETPQINGTETVYLENITIHTPSLDKTSLGYGCSNKTMSHTVNFFGDIFPSTIAVPKSTAQKWMRIKLYRRKEVNLHLIDGFNPWLAPNNITRHMERLATAMTNVVRSSPSNETVIGHAYSSEVFVQVRWVWLTFPLALLLLTLIFLVSTILTTSRGKGEDEVGVWKTSAMPTLIYSLPNHMQESLTPSSAWTNLHDKTLRIKLLPNKGWRMSGQACSTDTPITR